MCFDPVNLFRYLGIHGSLWLEIQISKMHRFGGASYNAPCHSIDGQRVDAWINLTRYDTNGFKTFSAELSDAAEWDSRVSNMLWRPFSRDPRVPSSETDYFAKDFSVNTVGITKGCLQPMKT